MNDPNCQKCVKILNNFFMALFLPDMIKVRAVYDFDPKQTNVREKRELSVILERTRVLEQIDHQHRHILYQMERYRHKFELNTMRKHGDIEYDREVSDFFRKYEDNENLKEFGLSVQGKQNTDAASLNIQASEAGWESDWESETEMESANETYVSEDEMGLYAVALPFKRGDVMVGIRPGNSR